MQVINHCMFKQHGSLALEHKGRIVMLGQTEGLFSHYLVFDNYQKYMLTEKS